MEKLKVALILPYFGPGGAEKMVSQLGCGLDGTQFHTEVFCVYGQPLGNALERALEEKGIPIHYIGKKKGFSLKAVWQLFRALDRFNPDVIHTHLYACVYAALWPFLRKKPFLHTFHTLPEVENRRPVRLLLTKFLVKTKRMIPVAISPSNRERVARFYALDTVPMVQNSVDVEKFSPGERPEREGFSFITAGRFSREKNQQMMYRAFAAFLERGHDARLVMLGKGVEEANLHALARELGIQSRIQCPGHVDNVAEYLKQADVFLLSSWYEAQPLCVLEAMAAGLPIVSTNVGGVRDIVTDNGILTSAGDLTGMVQAMEKLYLDRELRSQMAAASRKNVRGYDVSNTVAGYSELYRRYANKK